MKLFKVTNSGNKYEVKIKNKYQLYELLNDFCIDLDDTLLKYPNIIKDESFVIAKDTLEICRDEYEVLFKKFKKSIFDDYNEFMIVLIGWCTLEDKY